RAGIRDPAARRKCPHRWRLLRRGWRDGRAGAVYVVAGARAGRVAAPLPAAPRPVGAWITVSAAREKAGGSCRLTPALAISWQARSPSSNASSSSHAYGNQPGVPCSTVSGAGTASGQSTSAVAASAGFASLALVSAPQDSYRGATATARDRILLG